MAAENDAGVIEGRVGSSTDDGSSLPGLSVVIETYQGGNEMGLIDHDDRCAGGNFLSEWVRRWSRTFATVELGDRLYRLPREKTLAN